MESVDVIRVSELLSRSRPCTASCSLHHASSIRPRVRQRSSPVTVDSEFGFGECEKDSSFPTLEVLDRRAVLIGKVVLPNEDVQRTCICPSGNNCLVFFDGDVGICCDILSFDVGLIRREIRVVAWNYIQFKGNGGFLEIITWEFSDSVSRWMRPCSGVSSLQLESTDSVDCMDDPKAKYFAHGFVEAVSPVKVQRIGDKEDDGVTSIRGFLVDIMSCQCKLCKLKDSEVVFCSASKGGSSGHCYDKCVTVYFSGSVSSLHPVITKLVGNFIFLSCLRKKMVFIGRKECQLMYMTTKKSLLRVLKRISRQPAHNNVPFKGKGESGVYTGVIKGIYLQGMLMELDNEVWLLLAEKLASLLHSLRVGALITVQNVHFMKCKFSWTKKLILGGCVRTVINVQRFSPLTASVCSSSQSASQLGKFIGSLTFSARLWVLLLVASFRKKFAGILSEKEILGSKHSKGLAQKYASSHLPYLKARSQSGVFMDFCHHHSSECASEENTDHLKLVLPISNCIHQFGYSHPRKDMSCPLLDYGESNSRPIKNITSSEDINVVLIGRLQISPSTGRLQLVDATGSIDVVIPDLSSNLDAQNIYEVKRYNLLREDLPARVDTSVLKSNLFSVRHILQYFPPSKADITPYVLCHMEDVNVIKHSSDWDKYLNQVCNGTFHLLELTHKFPMLQNADPAISDHISRFAEVNILPWNLILDPRCSYPKLSKDCEDGRAEVIKHIGCESDQEASYNKRRKCDYVAQNGLCSSFKKLNGTTPEAASLVNFVFVPCIKSSTLQTCDSNCPVQLPCSIHIRSGENHNRVLPGLLNRVKSDLVKESGNITANARKMLLEFKSDTFLEFEALQIGGYYILKNEKAESCESSEDISSTKVVITPVRKIWNFSFAYIDSLDNFSFGDTSLVDSCNDDIVINSSGHCQTEMLLQRSNAGWSTACSDIEVHFSSKFRSFLEGSSRDIQEGSLKSLVAPHKIPISLPEGKLISFCGHVMAVDSSDPESSRKSTFETFGGFNKMKYHQGSSTYSRIHVVTSNDIVRVLICTSVLCFPIGFRPGVDAHFHRILHSRADEYLLTPVSFVEITTSKKHNSYEQSSLSRASMSSELSTFESVTSGLIYQMMHCSESRPQWIRCRVLAIHKLVFEKNDRNITDYPDIPLAGFILDDGSSTCCCWANADKAAAVLKMHEKVPCQAIQSKSWTKRKTRCSTVSHHLKRILKNQGRITVTNYGSVYESAGPDFIISITTPKILDESDEAMIKWIVINACAGKPLNVLGSVMDPDAVKRLERHITEMEMTIPPMPNIWANEVCFANPLDEARDLIQDLL
ncbi:hypothetical protein QQ045_012754 [Rhodiola kirilowii]